MTSLQHLRIIPIQKRICTSSTTKSNKEQEQSSLFNQDPMSPLLLPQALLDKPDITQFKSVNANNNPSPQKKRKSRSFENLDDNEDNEDNEDNDVNDKEYIVFPQHSTITQPPQTKLIFKRQQYNNTIFSSSRSYLHPLTSSLPPPPSPFLPFLTNSNDIIPLYTNTMNNNDIFIPTQVPLVFNSLSFVNNSNCRHNHGQSPNIPSNNNLNNNNHSNSSDISLLIDQLCRLDCGEIVSTPVDE